MRIDGLPLSGLLRASGVHGLLFDGAVLLGNLLLFGVLPPLGNREFDPYAGTLLLVAVFAQILGAGLKAAPLGRRLRLQGAADRDGLARALMTGLLFLHFILFTVATLLALGVLEIYQPAPTSSLSRSDVWVAFAMLVGGLATLTVRRAEHGETGGEAGESGFVWQEWAADALLWASVAVLTHFFWGSLVELIEPGGGAGFSLRSLVLLVAMSLLFVCFYLPGRYLFLVEDYRAPRTWVQVWLAMLPVAWTVVFG